MQTKTKASSHEKLGAQLQAPGAQEVGTEEAPVGGAVPAGVTRGGVKLELGRSCAFAGGKGAAGQARSGRGPQSPPAHLLVVRAAELSSPHTGCCSAGAASIRRCGSLASLCQKAWRMVWAVT